MAESNTASASGGIGFAGWLTLLFIFLKLNPGGNFTTSVVDWSWWWVLSPIWITFAVVIVILSLVLLGFFVSERNKTKRRAALYKRLSK